MALGAKQDAVDGLVEVGRGHDALVLSGRAQGRLVDKVPQVGSDEAWRAAGNSALLISSFSGASAFAPFGAGHSARIPADATLTSRYAIEPSARPRERLEGELVRGDAVLVARLVGGPDFELLVRRFLAPPLGSVRAVAG